MLSAICFAGKMVHKECLGALFNNSEVISLIVDGPELTALPFLVDSREFAGTRGVESFDSADLSPDQLTAMAVHADVGICVGYGRILRKQLFEAPRLGTFNLHPSALPKYRGKHPCQYAIMDGQTDLGVTLHRMDTGIDTGPIVGQGLESINPGDDVVSLTDRLYIRGAELVARLLGGLEDSDTIDEIQQPKTVDPIEVRYAIDWRDSAWRIHNQVRALTFPWPMARTQLLGQSLLVAKVRVVEDGVIDPGLVLAVSPQSIRVGTGGHSIEILEVRGEGRQVIPLMQLASRLESKTGQVWFGSDPN